MKLSVDIEHKMTPDEIEKEVVGSTRAMGIVAIAGIALVLYVVLAVVI